MDEPLLPTIEPTAESAPWWAALAEGKLTVQRCCACGAVRLWPRPMCATCHSMDYDWVPASGFATAHSWTVTHHSFHPAMARCVPFAMVAADLAEGVRLLGRFHGDPAILKSGLPLRVVMDKRPDGLAVPAFKAAASFTTTR